MSFRRNQIVKRLRPGVSVRGGVREKLASGDIGRICRVISPGVSYMVAYTGRSKCYRQFHRSLAASRGSAPSCDGMRDC